MLSDSEASRTTIGWTRPWCDECAQYLYTIACLNMVTM
jgi:hypothetical protein